MSDMYWDTVEPAKANALHLDEDGDVVTSDVIGTKNEIRHRYRAHDGFNPGASSWLFLQNIDGVWFWWTTKDSTQTYYAIPAARTEEEAKAAAIASWRTS